MERRLSAILAADVVAYSDLMGRDEAGALALIQRLRGDLFEPEVTRSNGTVVKRLGDGWLVEFASAVDAVRCAVAIQENMKSETAALRIGVHIGDVVHADGDIYGDGVNIAARLEAAGAPGYVTLSNDIWRQIRSSVGVAFHDNGPHDLKNITDPVHVWSWPAPLPGGPVNRVGRSAKPALHVARFEARGAEATEMAAALRDDLVGTFGRQTGLVLVGDGSDADFVLAGTVRGGGGRWRIGALLAEQATGSGVWSDSFDERGADEFEIQDRVVERIAGGVRIRLPRLLADRMAAQPLEEMSVENLLNQAMAHHFLPTLESWERAAQALSLAIQKDDENWMAMTMLSFNRLATGRIFGWQGISAENAALAHRMIDRARALKANDHVVRYVHGAIQLYLEHNLQAARVEIDESLRLNPNFYHAIDVMAQVELFDGRVDRARAQALRALDCDPAYPYVHLYQRDAGQVELVAGAYDLAADRFLRADNAAPGLPQNLIGRAAALALAGRQQEAGGAIHNLLAIAPEATLTGIRPWPFADQAKWQPIADALLLAGLPR